MTIIQGNRRHFTVCGTNFLYDKKTDCISAFSSGIMMMMFMQPDIGNIVVSGNEQFEVLDIDDLSGWGSIPFAIVTSHHTGLSPWSDGGRPCIYVRLL